MHETEDKNSRTPDPLAEIIRAAGRRRSPPAEHYQQVYAASRRAWRAKVRSRRRNRWIALAASVIAVAGLSGIVGSWLQNTDAGPAASVAIATGTVERSSPETESWLEITESGITLAHGARIRTGQTGRAALDLEGGGSIRLNVNTEIVIGADAFELTAGTLYFDSAGRPRSRPIDIGTPIGDVRDIGTQFEISVTEESLRVRVREGEVLLLRSPAAEELTGESGEEIEMSTDGRLSRRRIEPDDPLWEWTEALASVPDTGSRSILTYFRWIGRETGKRLEWESDSVELAAELAIFSGDPEGLSPLALLSSIAATSNFYYRLTDDGAIVIGRN